jgi:hypothetical protein
VDAVFVDCDVADSINNDTQKRPTFYKAGLFYLVERAGIDYKL